MSDHIGRDFIFWFFYLFYLIASCPATIPFYVPMEFNPHVSKILKPLEAQGQCCHALSEY